MPPDDLDPQPLGWDAIEAACRLLYGDQKPLHWAPIISPILGGGDPLQGTSAYAADHGKILTIRTRDATIVFKPGKKSALRVIEQLPKYVSASREL